MVLWFAGMEQTFRLFTADGFGMSDAATGRIFAIVGIVGAIVQGGVVRRAGARAFGEARLIQLGPRHPGGGVRAARRSRPRSAAGRRSRSTRRPG